MVLKIDNSLPVSRNDAIEKPHIPEKQENIPLVTSWRGICEEHFLCLQESDLSKKEQIRRGIERVAEKTGVSEAYLRTVLLPEEKLHLKVYDDGVKENENDTHGTFTIGYGHTRKIPGWYFDDPDYEYSEEYEITEENKDDLKITIPMAFDLLMKDILAEKQKAIDFLGEEAFNNAPQSVRDAIIDAVFNKGIEKNFINNPDSPTYRLKEDLENQDYASAAAHVIYATPNMGLKKRNIMRFTHAVKDLSEQDRETAKQEGQKYYEKVHMELLQKTPRFNHSLKPTAFWESVKAEYHLTKIENAWNNTFK